LDHSKRRLPGRATRVVVGHTDTRWCREQLSIWRPRFLLVNELRLRKKRQPANVVERPDRDRLHAVRVELPTPERAALVSPGNDSLKPKKLKRFQLGPRHEL